jgi:hypothetical protein
MSPSEEFLTSQRVVAKAAQPATAHEIAVRLVHAARRHAVMRRLDNYADALRFQDVIDRVGNLRGHLFLNLQAPGIDVDHRQLLARAVS